MATLRGCVFPETLLYHPESMVWLREEQDGLVTLGLSALATATGGEMLTFAARPIGAALEAGRAVGNVETAKTVSSVRTPIAARLVEANAAVEANGELIGRDPYAAWLVRLEPIDWPRDRAMLVTGDAAMMALDAQLALYRVGE